MAGNSFCLKVKMGKPGKYSGSWLYERKGQNQRPVQRKSIDRELLTALRVLPLRAATMPPGSESSATSASPDAPVSVEEVLVSWCRLDLIALTWSSFRSGVWEVASRLWSRPTPPEDAKGGPFAPGEPLVGLSLPEQLLGGGSTLDDLRNLFSPNPEAWRMLLDDQDGILLLRRDLDSESPALIVAEQAEATENRHWQLLRTRLARDVRLICWTAKSAPS
jgi:hypothetical protein